MGPLVAPHVAAHAESLPTASTRAFERLLAGVTVAVDAQITGTAEDFLARRADVAAWR